MSGPITRNGEKSETAPPAYAPYDGGVVRGVAVDPPVVEGVAVAPPPPQQPAMMQVQVQVPLGAPPGSIFTVAVNGQTLQVLVPPNAAPGATMMITVPAAAPSGMYVNREPGVVGSTIGAVDAMGRAVDNAVTQQAIAQTSQAFDAQPVVLTCPHCGHAGVTTLLLHRAGLMTWGAAAGACICGCWCCACVPFCLDDLKDVTHTCPQCHMVVGEFKRIK